MIHPLADVQTKKIGENTRIWQYAVVLQGASIGKDCNVNCHTFIENDVLIGDRVTVKSGVFLWDGLTVEDDVFIGPNVTFTNDKYPRSKQYPDEFQRTVIRKGASIGAASVILGGCTIGENSMVGAGSLVTHDVPPNTLVMGRPARVVRKLVEDAE
ncbi:acyltransferase [Algoriphagus halophilus]|uniref:Carbonic anhydrase or acetyltransferase, isoleucine patch superfamily n=1 Tax=Algoriphagus halophilus TaxID=226505 RepID=A0A1N6EDV8_9BACT|nr:acyltransferase [Algoriphagus halophilus]SIN81190.1 Carbonic anhydrase or acetyltransferase, isoleucine patch superfamily [Algoriphagus halophilus]